MACVISTLGLSSNTKSPVSFGLLFRIIRGFEAIFGGSQDKKLHPMLVEAHLNDITGLLVGFTCRGVWSTSCDAPMEYGLKFPSTESVDREHDGV